MARPISRALQRGGCWILEGAPNTKATLWYGMQNELGAVRTDKSKVWDTHMGVYTRSELISQYAFANAAGLLSTTVNPASVSIYVHIDSKRST